MIKRAIAVLIAIPLGVSVLAKSASATEFRAMTDPVRAPIVVADRGTPEQLAQYQREQLQRQEAQQAKDRQEQQRDLQRPQTHRVRVAGYWQRTAHGRQWVPAHWETRR